MQTLNRYWQLGLQQNQYGVQHKHWLEISNIVIRETFFFDEVSVYNTNEATGWMVGSMIEVLKEKGSDLKLDWAFVGSSASAGHPYSLGHNYLGM
jgi:hypothetical protein